MRPLDFGGTVGFTPPLDSADPIPAPACPGFQPAPAVRYMDPDFDPAKVPDDQIIAGRQPRPLSAIEWLGEAVKTGFYRLVRTFEITGILFSIWWHGASVESIEQAVARSRGGILVKAIQFACSSPEIARDLFKDDGQKFLDALSYVTTTNQPMSKAELEHCLQEAGVPWDPDKLDERINLGAGSIGEVNEIILHGGGHLVVKVVSPASETRVYSDLQVLRFFLGLVSLIKPATLGAGTRQAIYAFFDSVQDELNLINEAQSTQKQHYAFRAIDNDDHYHLTDHELPPCAMPLPIRENGIAIRDPRTGQVLLRLPVNYKVPEISVEHTTQRTLSMARINGVTLSENDQDKLADLAVQLFGEQASSMTDEDLTVFRFYLKSLAFQHWACCYAQTGFFNGDMHDGNLMVAVENGELSIYFIDLGNAQRVSRETVKATYTILGAMERLQNVRDEDQRDHYADIVINNLRVMGDYHPEKANWARLRQDIKSLMRDGASGTVSGKVIDVFNLAYPCHVNVPKEIVALFRARVLIDSQQALTNRAALDRVIPSLVNRYRDAV